MTKNLALGIGLLALTAAPSFAADLPVGIPTKGPIMVPVTYNWTGCYVGGHAGGAWSRSSYTLDNGAGLVESFSYNPSSFMGGGQIGCQVQFASNWVAGIEGTWSWVRLNQTDVSVLAPPRQRSLSVDQMATVTGKLGYTWDRWMLYAKGGFAEAKIDAFAINPLTGVSADSNKWQSGWTVGGGLDYLVTPNFVVGVEVNYYRFGFDRSAAATDGTISTFFNTRTEVYSALARASWLFNWGGPVVARY